MLTFHVIQKEGHYTNVTRYLNDRKGACRGSISPLVLDDEGKQHAAVPWPNEGAYKCKNLRVPLSFCWTELKQLSTEKVLIFGNDRGVTTKWMREHDDGFITASTVSLEVNSRYVSVACHGKLADMRINLTKWGSLDAVQTALTQQIWREHSCWIFWGTSSVPTCTFHEWRACVEACSGFTWCNGWLTSCHPASFVCWHVHTSLSKNQDNQNEVILMQERTCVHGTIMGQLDSRECRRRRAMTLCKGLFENVSFPCFDGSSAFSRDQEPQNELFLISGNALQSWEKGK